MEGAERMGEVRGGNLTYSDTGLVMTQQLKQFCLQIKDIT